MFLHLASAGYKAAVMMTSHESSAWEKSGKYVFWDTSNRQYKKNKNIWDINKKHVTTRSAQVTVHKSAEVLRLWASCLPLQHHVLKYYMLYIYIIYYILKSIKLKGALCDIIAPLQFCDAWTPRQISLQLLATAEPPQSEKRGYNGDHATIIGFSFVLFCFFSVNSNF